MKVNPFDTKDLEGGWHRDGYHDNNQCSDGKRVKPENRGSGTDGLHKCEECKALS